MQADRLTHQIYTWTLADTGITNWAEHTSNLLSSLYETTYSSKLNTILWMIFGMQSWSKNFKPGDCQWKLSQMILRLVAASFSTDK